jgi:hypothetical protein
MKRSKQFFAAMLFALPLFTASGAFAQDAAKADYAANPIIGGSTI